MKCYKPSGHFFKQIMDDSALSADNVLFVGDSVTDDIMGAKAIGMKTVWIDRDGVGGDFGQDYTITNLNELIDGILK